MTHRRNTPGLTGSARRVGAGLLLGWALTGGCTNDYEDFAYTPAESSPGGSGSNCNDDDDCEGDAQCNGGVCTCFGGNACSQAETCCVPQGCVDLDDHPSHCGGCRQACQAGMDCNNGACSF